ncbi:MAG TPA: PAS domain S-box protein [Candidatus Acidoferrum sp.]|jgi:PAS domain S-box-containing protein|nr:PAS domain S-box protein [Candidatus Acidoferrum sp.]
MKSQAPGSSPIVLPWSRRRGLCFGVLVWAVYVLAPARAGQELLTLREMKSLTPRQAAEGPAVRLKGVVVCYDAGWHQLYLHDGLETLYFNADDFTTQLETGIAVEITGRARGTNVVEHPQLSILGPAPLPAAKALALSELGREHGEWIETTGRVLSAETSRGRLALLIHEKGQNCLAYVLGSPPTQDYAPLLGCRVRLRCINASKVNGGRLESPLVFVPGLREVTVLGQPSGVLAPIPVVSIGSLLNRELGSWTNQWVHVNGLVVLYRPGQSVLIKDPTGVVRAQVIQLTEIRGDERVDVWGFLEVGPHETFLNNAYFEVVHAPPPDLATHANGRASTTADVPTEPLTQVGDILKLSREQAAQRLQVRLRGVITYADSQWRNGFIQDGADAIYVYLDPNQTNICSGQWVELTGQTSPGGFAPEVVNATVRVLGMTNLPAPARVDLEDLANGHLDAHWVEMEGVVRRVEEQAGHASLSVMTAKGRFNVIVPGYESKPLPTHLIDALVSVRGACTSELNVRRQLSGITLHVPGSENVQVLEAPSADPFAIDATRIESVATFDPGRLAGRRVKIQGVVTLQMPGQGFIVQDLSGGLRVLTRQTNEVHMGDKVDVLGFPAIGDFSPFLEEAAFRQTGTGRMPEAKQTTAEQILLHGTHDMQVVQVNARLLQSVPRSASPQLVLQDGPIIFTAHLEPQTPRSEVPALQSGSLLRLTGVCGIQGGERHEPATFRLLLSRPEDIQLVETPPWWTARHTFMLAGGLSVVILAALAWIALLRRQVAAQTTLIRQKLKDEAALEERFQDLFENANDMLYTHDREGRLTSINQTGERLLQLARADILSRNLIEFVVEEQQGAARQWLDQVLKGGLLAATEWDFIASSGQRVKLEISTRLIEQDGRRVEVEGIARDITERKRLEREILEISNREQQRIGHDLHDGVCQQLAGIAFMTSTLADDLEESGFPQSSEANKISTMINEVIDQTRGVARGLFPVRLEENGLAAALEELAVNAGELFKINCRFVAEEAPPTVENAIALHLYYIVLEAVANASKHGQAAQVVIAIERRGERYVLSVRDDGVGFLPSGAAQTGMGLRIMHYRARVIGATLTLQSRPGSGTTVACLFSPVSREAAPPSGRENPVAQGAKKKAERSQSERESTPILPA